MNYSFACPAPCKREITVDANDHLDAVEKIIMAGAMSCRNIHNRCNCRHARLDLPPIPEEQLRRIVSVCTREELRHLYQELMTNAKPKDQGERYTAHHGIATVPP